MSISRRDALRGATAAAVVSGAATAPLAFKAALGREPLIVLGRQWAEAYDKWKAAPREGESHDESIAMEDHADELGKIAWELEDKIAKVPAFSVEGVLVKLRIAGTHYHLMERRGDEWADTYAHLTWQAWDALERLAGEARS